VTDYCIRDLIGDRLFAFRLLVVTGCLLPQTGGNNLFSYINLVGERLFS